MKKRSLKRWIAAVCVAACVTAGFPVTAADVLPQETSTAVETLEEVDILSEEEVDEVSDVITSEENLAAEAEVDEAADEETSDADEAEDTSDANDAVEDPDADEAEEEPYANIIYQGHVENIGWQDEVSNGEIAGTSGQALRVEGMKIRVDSNLEGGITYRTHVQNIGWQDWVSDGELAGTTGKAYRLEAIEIELTGELSEEYDVYYRTHVENIGWLGWAKNGASAGSEAYAFRMEAVQLKLVKKGETDPEVTGDAKAFAKLGVSYTSHVENIGWQDAVSNGATSGTSGKALRLEGMKINLDSYWGNQISYKTHVQNIGWQDWVSSGALAGTTGQALRLEAIQIKLTGTSATLFDVYYRVHAENIGWMGWAKNGASAGTEGYSYRLEAIQIKVLPKGSAAPGSTSDAYRKYVAKTVSPTASNSTAYSVAPSNPQNYSSTTKYLILVNNSTCRVTIYTGKKGNWTAYKSMPCCVGAPSTPTLRGVYYVGAKGKYFNTGTQGRCWYYTQFKGNYLFHSVIYDRQSTPKRILDGTMGKQVSHGCVRLSIDNAKWIYDNIPTNTTVVTF